MTKWISVLDKLPDKVGYSTDYLTRMDSGDMAVSAWMNIGGWDWKPESPITHWMHLPEQPTENIYSNVTICKTCGRHVALVLTANKFKWIHKDRHNYEHLVEPLLTDRNVSLSWCAECGMTIWGFPEGWKHQEVDGFFYNHTPRQGHCKFCGVLVVFDLKNNRWIHHDDKEHDHAAFIHPPAIILQNFKI